VSGAATPHRLPVRVYYEDTDAGGIVYHARYLCFAERARTELLRDLGIDHHRLLVEDGGLFAVRRASIDFRRAARLDDLLVVETGVRFARGARLKLRQNIKKETELFVSIDVELAFISPDLRPRRLPARLSKGFAALGHLPSGNA
jgi:acyl-CoA thioester hydrolase